MSAHHCDECGNAYPCDCEEEEDTPGFGSYPCTYQNVQKYFQHDCGKSEKDAAALVLKYSKLVDRGQKMLSLAYYVGGEIIRAEAGNYSSKLAKECAGKD